LLLDGVAAFELLVVTALLGGLLGGGLLVIALLNNGAGDGGSSERGNGEDGELHVDLGWGFGIGNPKKCLSVCWEYGLFGRLVDGWMRIVNEGGEGPLYRLQDIQKKDSDEG